jgi:murein L,D-transpeptidase YcbB/YkuD
MYYADLAAWADFREQNPAPVATMGEGAAMPAPNIFEQRFTAAATRFSQKWGSLPQQRVEPGPTLSEGASGPRVAALRSRLGLAPGSLFDAELAQRIADYRRAHGLSSGTQADGALIASLNLGHAHYARLIELNTKRTKQFPANPGNRFVLVDSAEQRLYMYENGQPVDSMKVIVGKPADQTPMLAGFISFAEINPYWNVPPDLVRERYAARVISGGKNYLDTRGFEVLESWEDDARVLSFAEVDWKAVQAGRQSVWMRQKPGAGNGMGRVKFMFPNRYGVYLHDTPSKNLFDKAERLESAGCVRVERPWDLARWLYGRDLDWRGRPNAQRVDVPNPVPVYLTYFTAVPNGEGFEFRTDVYGKDRYAL